MNERRGGEGRGGGLFCVLKRVFGQSCRAVGL